MYTHVNMKQTNKFIKLEDAKKWIEKNIRNYIENDNFLRIYDFIDDFVIAMQK